EEYTAGDFVEDWDVDGLLRRIEEIFTLPAAISSIDPNQVDREDLTLRLQEEALAQYDRRERELGEELMRALERFLLLQIIDQRWREHLYDMDYLREGIHLRGFAQIEPLVAYKNEAYELFKDLMNSIWTDFAQMIYHVEVTPMGPDGQPLPPPAARLRPMARAKTALRRPRWRTSSSAESTTPSRSAATTPAGAGRARST